MEPINSRIYLIRHGITEGNKKMWHYGWADIPLLPEGVEKIKAFKEQGVYPEIEDGYFYTSGMIRTEMTFETIFGKREHKAIENLKEINFGEFEMKTYDEIKDDKRYQDWVSDSTGQAEMPGGESKMAFGQRVEKGFEEVMNLHRLKELSHRHDRKDANSVVVCHGGVIAGIMMMNFGNSWDEFFQWIPEPGRGYVLNVADGKCVSYEKL